MQSVLNESDSDAWRQLAPYLDQALNCLGEKEHDAVVLRFFNGKELKDVGAAMGTTEDAARMRVNRGLEKLREFFTKKGVTLSAAAIAGTVTANSVQAAPAGLAASITAAALSATAITTTAITAGTKTIAMTILQKTIVTTTIAVFAGVGIYETREASNGRAEIEALKRQQAPLADQIQQLQRERREAQNRLAQLSAELAKNEKDDLEVLKLRGEVTRLFRESQELAQVKSNAATKDEGDLANQSWLDRVKLLKQRLEQTPSEKNPEIQFLTEDDWLFAAKRKLDTDDDYRAAFSDLRGRGEANFLGTTESALRKYSATNSNVFPSDLSQLKPFFNNPPPDEILQRYQIVPADSLPQASIAGNTGEWLITLKSPDSGSLSALGTNGVSGSHYDADNSMGILAPAMEALLNATPVINGSRKVDIQRLEPYLTTPEQKAAYQRLMKSDKPAFQ